MHIYRIPYTRTLLYKSYWVHFPCHAYIHAAMYRYPCMHAYTQIHTRTCIHFVCRDFHFLFLNFIFIHTTTMIFIQYPINTYLYRVCMYVSSHKNIFRVHTLHGMARHANEWMNARRCMCALTTHTLIRMYYSSLERRRTATTTQ